MKVNSKGFSSLLVIFFIVVVVIGFLFIFLELSDKNLNQNEVNTTDNIADEVSVFSPQKVTDSSNKSNNPNNNLTDSTNSYENKYISFELPEPLHVEEVEFNVGGIIFVITITNEYAKNHMSGSSVVQPDNENYFSLSITALENKERQTIDKYLESYCSDLYRQLEFASEELEISLEECISNYNSLETNSIGGTRTKEGSFVFLGDERYYIIFENNSTIYLAEVYGLEALKPSEKSVKLSRDIVETIKFK